MTSDSLHRSVPLIGISLAPARIVNGTQLSYPAFSAAALAAYCQALEQGGASFVLLGDTPLDTQAITGNKATFALESFTLASWLAVKTRSLGIIASLNTNYREPFAFARLVASLDHVSAGRAGWFASIDETGNAAANHQANPTSLQQRQQRADEFISVVESLFDTWEEGAFVRNKESGQFIDTDRVHFLEHAGEHFRVRGPLNVAPAPQGRLVRVSTHALAADFDSATQGDIVLCSGRRAANASGELRDVSRPRCFLKRLTPCVADSIEAALAIAEHAGAGHADDRFTGTWDDWQAETQALCQAGGYDGLLLDLPEALALDAAYVRRLMRAAGAVAETPASRPDTLRQTLGLPRPQNRFLARQPG